MFISSFEKEQLRTMVQNLTVQITSLREEFENFKRHNEPLIKTAPWGVKVNGSPRMKPGRKTAKVKL